MGANMSNQGQQPIAPGTISSDGLYVWDGFKWWDAASVPVGTSLDGGQTVWVGHGWASQKPHSQQTFEQQAYYPQQGYQQQPPPPEQPTTVVNNTTVKKTGCIGGLLGLIGLVVIIILVMSFSGGSDTTSGPSAPAVSSQPKPSTTDQESTPAETPSESSSLDAIAAALSLTWNSKSASEQQSMCQAYKSDPRGAYAQFQSGAAQVDTQGISREDFDAFFSFKCS